MDTGVIKFLLFVSAFFILGYTITSQVPGISSFGVGSASYTDPANSSCAALDANYTLSNYVGCSYESVTTYASFIGLSAGVEGVNQVIQILSIVLVGVIIAVFVIPIIPG